MIFNDVCALRFLFSILVISYTQYTDLFVQLANVMGRSQWLTCPRKVTYESGCVSFTLQGAYIFDIEETMAFWLDNTCRTYQLVGFFVILVHCLSQSP